MKFLVLLILVVCFSKAPAKEEIENAVANDEVETCSNENNEQDDEAINCSCGRNGMKICLIQSSNLTEESPAWKHLLQHPRVKLMRIVVQGHLSFIPRYTFNRLHDLQKLEIQGATITELPAHAFRNMSALSQLSLEENNIGTLARKSFAHLPMLEELSLDNNLLRELPRNAFVDLPSLNMLFISRNNISILHDGAFEHLNSLLKLELHMNSIFVLTKNTFLGLKNLTKLDLSSNHISMLGEDTFSEMPALEELLINNNHIELITENAFEGLSNLRKLGLKDNKLSTLPPMVFASVPQLNYLDVSYNFLETLTSDNIRPIMHNLLSTTSYFIFEINHFSCDCRLAWMHRLHKQTNPRMRKQIEDMLCHLNLNQTQSEPETTEDVEYDYEYYDESHPSDTRRFLQIPLAELPCTEEDLASEEMREIMRVPTDASTNKPADMHSDSNSPSTQSLYNALSLAGIFHVVCTFTR